MLARIKLHIDAIERHRSLRADVNRDIAVEINKLRAVMVEAADTLSEVERAEIDAFLEEDHRVRRHFHRVNPPPRKGTVQ